MALAVPMVNMRKLLAESQAAIVANTDAKAAETKALVTVKAADTKDSVLADNAANLAAANSNTNSKTAALGVTLDSITTVNGNISTEVQAINGNTDAKIAEVQSTIAAKGIIKSIQRGETQLSGISSTNLAISPVDLSKSVINWTGTRMNSQETATVKFIDASTLQFYMNRSTSTDWCVTAWEVIEYE